MTQLSSQEYIQKPVMVEAWELQTDNLDLVANWCRGRRRGLSVVFPKIRSKAQLLEDQETNHYAVVGDYIIRTNKGFVKMTADEFHVKFSPTGKRTLKV
jgi:hypothetical protein